MDLDTVHPGTNGIARGEAIVLDDGGDFCGFEGARYRHIPPDAIAVFVNDESLAGHRQCARCDGQAGVRLKAGVRDAADMPQLHEDQPASAMHRAADCTPGLDLLITVNTRRPCVTLALARDLCGFGDDQRSAGALAVVLGVHRARHIARLAGARARQRRHGDAMGEGVRAEGDGLEQAAGHGQLQRCGERIQARQPGCARGRATLTGPGGGDNRWAALRCFALGATAPASISDERGQAQEGWAERLSGRFSQRRPVALAMALPRAAAIGPWTISAAPRKGSPGWSSRCTSTFFGSCVKRRIG